MTSTASPSDFQISISTTVRFWLFVIPNSLSILCSFFVLYYLLFDRKLRKGLHNHVIIILVFAGLIYELTTIPLMLHYFRVGKNWKRTLRASRLWTFIDILCYSIQIIGFAWASIERHILIFHNQWVSTRKTRFFVHYLPLMILLIYCLIYHFVLLLFPFCEEVVSPSPLNGLHLPCSFFHPVIGKWDTICHQIIPTTIIVIFSISLLVRILWQKTRLNRSIQWRKQRKMAMQLLSISVLYFLFNLPRTILQLVCLIAFKTNELQNAYYTTVIFAIYIVFLFPFVCCGSIPGVRKKLKVLFCCGKQQQGIVPDNGMTTRIENE